MRTTHLHLQDGVTSQHGEFLSHSTKTALLESRITQLSPEDMTGSAWDVYQLYFYKVRLCRAHVSTVMHSPAASCAQSHETATPR